MISVRGGENARKGVELGFGSGDMEGTELEEGEASFDSTVDPDIALSYLDEKLHDVLGHFQKDFEGGVSAENLGSKFGGYGSFLPTYQRSPSWSHPRTPPEVYDNHNTPRSPNNMPLEGGRQNSVSASSTSLLARPGITSSNRPEPRAQSGNDQVNRDVRVLSTNGEEMTLEVGLEKSTNFSDQKALKFRIKVGVDDLSTRKNAEIYSGLGLDVSPSSSLDDSPTESEGLYHDLQDTPDESPISILQIMTSVRLFGGLLLSPLSDHVTQLAEKGGFWGERKSKIVHKANLDGTRLAGSGSDLAMISEKVLGEKKPKLIEKPAVSVELSNTNNKDTFNGIGIASKKEVDIDTSACEELVSNALKLPLLSNKYYDFANSEKDVAKSVTTSSTAVKTSETNDYQPNVAEEEPLEPVTHDCKIEKSNRNVGLSEKARESVKQISVDENSVYQKKEVCHKEDKAEFPIKIESTVSEERKFLKLDDPSKQKVDCKVASQDEDGLKATPWELQSLSGGKKKYKGNQNQCPQGTEFQDDSLIFNSSMVPKCKKTSNSNILLSKSDSEGLKKVHGKATDKYKEFFGDLELEKEDDEIASEKMPSVRRVKDSELVEKRNTSECNIAKEKLNGKKVEGIPVSGNHPKSSSYRPPPAGKGPNHDAATPMLAPLVKEDWVCCDKCQTWRLLPLGTNPESLPEKWICSMLDWLPGMNRCSVSEEETTNALRALYQVPASVAPLASASGSQLDQHTHPGRTLLGVSQGDTRRSTEDRHISGLQTIATGGKKKCGSKDVTSATSQDGPIQSSNPKKNLQATENRNLNEVDHSPSVDEFGSQYVGQPGGSVAGRYAKEKEKKILLDNNSDEGDGTKSKMKNPRESDIDGLQASKKIKTEDVRNMDENCTSDGGASSKAGQNSNSASWKDSHKYSNCYRDSKVDPKKKSSVSCEKIEVQLSVASDDGSFKMDKSGSTDSVKKRKGKEHQNADVDCVLRPSSRQHSQGSKGYLEDIRENGHRKEKKARVSKSEGKDSNGNKDIGVSGTKVRSMMDQEMGQDLDSTPSQRSMDAADSFRRDLGSGQPSVAATSSSSKVSGSRKSKTNHQEMKGSPVESVSSSPLRISTADKLTQVAGYFAAVSPRRSLDGEDLGVSDQSVKVKDDIPNVSHLGSLESTVLDFRGKDLDDIASPTGKAVCISSTGLASECGPDSKIISLGQGSQNASQTKTSEEIRDEGKRNGDHHPSNVPHSKKSGKGSSSRSKEKIRSSLSEFDNGNESSYDEKMKAGRNKFQEKSSSSSDRTERHVVSKKDSTGKLVRETSKVENQPKVGGRDGSIVRPDVNASQDMKQNVPQDSNNDRSSRKPVSDKTGVEVSGRGKSHPLPPSMRGQADTMIHLQPIVESHIENGEYKERDAILKASKQSKKAEKQNGNQPVNVRHPTPPTQKSRDLDAPSPVRRDSSSQAVTNAVKEAKDLKHLADRFKNSGSTESTGYYFQAALKFLHGASLLESSNSENTKHNEMSQSMQMYSSTAKFCEFCAHEYEKSKDMAAAALAYKCMEVAYMRVIYTLHNSASRDRNELQAALQLIPTGESPSSSASDIDNLNNPVNVDKAVQGKAVGSPQVAGNHVLTARHRSSFMRLINHARNVNNAMEASRKSRNAFAAANPKSDGPQHKEGISSVKRALDFNFQDVDGLLRLVRVAVEAINR